MLSFLLQALEGFLFVVNHDGKIEYVTDNISSFIKFTKDEVLGKPVYNILHHGDHGRFTTTLLPSVWSTLEGSSSSVVASGLSPYQTMIAPYLQSVFCTNDVPPVSFFLQMLFGLIEGIRIYF